MNSLVCLQSFLFLVNALASRKPNIPIDCRINPRDTIKCEESIPGYIPRGVVNVVIENYKQHNISNNTFTSINWRNVRKLDINVNTIVDFTLTDYNFYSLNNVKMLGIHSRRLEKMYSNTLQGLISLRILDLSECSSIPIGEVEAALLTYPYPLDYLNLDQVGIRSLKISGSFVNMVIAKRISKLSLCGTNLFPVGPLKISAIPSNLKYLDISNSTILPSHSYSYIDRKQLVLRFLKNVEILNLTSMPYTFLNFDFRAIRKVNGKACHSVFGKNDHNHLFPMLKVLEMNDLLKFNVILNSSVVNLTCIQQIHLKTLSFTRNNIQWINITLLLPSELSISNIDLSSNAMQYLSPNFIGQFCHLKVLNLANNSLGYMERYNEFRNIFSKLQHLTKLNIACNSFTRLPDHIFISNVKLRRIDLHGNKLKTINFKIQHLHLLRILNLSFNDIVTLDESIMSVLGNALYANDETEKRMIYIDLKGNPFVCKCENILFIKWLLTALLSTQDQLYKCLFEGKDVVIDKEVIKKTQFLCYRTMVIVLSVVFIVTIATTIFVVAGINISRTKRQRRELTRDRFIDNFLSGRLGKNYISFLVYASEDLDETTKALCRCLNESLQDILHTNQSLVSTGDLNIAPGYPIMDEVLRCVSEACTLIVIASRNFCDSEWCQIELREAYQQQMPIILLFKEEVEERLMSPTMLAVFKNFTRAKLIARGDAFETVPEWQTVIESVINLASDFHNRQ